MIENSTNYHSGDNLDYVNTYEYKYDNKGNWVEKISYSEKTGKRKEPYQITERTIEYYE
jgi:hypothetical protein